MFLRLARTLVPALALVVSGLGSLLLAPSALLPAASSATCTSAGGVSVVVDFRELGGSTITACAADGGGRSAAAIFESVGVSISYAQRQPGFVCKVAGQPADSPCVNASPADAYWGLWWSDGSTGSWTYSSSGVGGLVVPAGGSVGWSWQQDRQSGNTVPPAVAPPVAPAATPSPSPTPSPTSSPSSPSSPSPTGGGSGGDGGKGGPPSPTHSPSSSGTPSESPSASSSAAPSESPVGVESPSDSTSKKGAGEGARDQESTAKRSPSRTSDASPSGTESGRESPGDSAATGASEAGTPSADEPARVPAALTWGVVGLLAIGIAVGGVVARRRRGA